MDPFKGTPKKEAFQGTPRKGLGDLHDRGPLVLLVAEFISPTKCTLSVLWQLQIFMLRVERN